MKTKDEMLTQVKLASDKGVFMTTWVDADPRVRKGVVLSLKKDDRLWRVQEVYSTMPRGATDNHGWDNNNYDKHVGLGV